MKKFIFAVIVLMLLCSGCGRKGAYAPKPTAYLRIELPAHEYFRYDTTPLPFTFECSRSAVVSMKKDLPTDKWVDINYPDYKGVVYLSYRKIGGPQEVEAQVDTSYLYLKQHFNHASGVDEKAYEDPSRKVYAATYQLKGDNVASTYQFWVTDSSRHFLRGSLFLDCAPSNDSLAPVIEFMQEDLRHLLETIEWR